MRLGLQGSKPTPKPQATGAPPRGRLCRPQHLAPPPAPCAAPRRGGKQAPADEIWFYYQRGPYGFLSNFYNRQAEAPRLRQRRAHRPRALRAALAALLPPRPARLFALLVVRAHSSLLHPARLNAACSKVVVDGVTYRTAEHYFQSQKFRGTGAVHAGTRCADPRMAGGLPHHAACCHCRARGALPPSPAARHANCRIPTNTSPAQLVATQHSTAHAAADEASREAARVIREAKTPMEAKKLAGQPQKLGVQGKKLEGYGAIGWFSGAC